MLQIGGRSLLSGHEERKYLSLRQLVLADDDQQRHAALQRLRQLLLELGVFGVAASEGREAEVCL